MTKKAQRSKTPAPVSDSVVDAMEARLEHAQDHAATPASPAPAPSSTHGADSAEESHASHAPHAPHAAHTSHDETNS